jgi:hypothetical protein
MSSDQTTPTINYDLCLAWNWPFDRDFVNLLSAACRKRNLSLLQATPEKVEGIERALRDNRIFIRVFLDRAAESDPRYLFLDAWARDYAVYRINPFERAARSWDKATMHLALIGAGIQTPHTILLPSWQEEPSLEPVDLSPLQGKFTIKPAHGSGGVGVILEATSWEEALSARRNNPDDRYLLQAHVEPVVLKGRPAWFRVLFCAGAVYPCWWDTRTHAYIPVSTEEEESLDLAPLRTIPPVLARLSGLDSFSTEIALTPQGLFTAVDYINDQIDLRLQSRAPDGVPDAIVADIAERIAGLAAEKCAEAVLPSATISVGADPSGPRVPSRGPERSAATGDPIAPPSSAPRS